jgi:hypothetical protein
MAGASGDDYDASTIGADSPQLEAFAAVAATAGEHPAEDPYMSSYYRVCSAVEVAADSPDTLAARERRKMLIQDDLRLQDFSGHTAGDPLRPLAEAVLLPPWQQLLAELEGPDAAVAASGSGGVQAAAASSASVQAPAVVAEAAAAPVAGSISVKLVEAVRRALLAGKN